MQETEWMEWALIIIRPVPWFHLPHHLFIGVEVGRQEIQATDEVFRGLDGCPELSHKSLIRAYLNVGNLHTEQNHLSR